MSTVYIFLMFIKLPYQNYNKLMAVVQGYHRKIYIFIWLLPAGHKWQVQVSTAVNVILWLQLPDIMRDY